MRLRIVGNSRGRVRPPWLGCGWHLAAATASNCNNLKVYVSDRAKGLVQFLSHEENEDTVCDEKGRIIEITKHYAAFYGGGGTLGLGCDLMMLVNGTMTRYELDQNECWLEAGDIDVQFWQGTRLKYCIEKGSLAGNHPGKVTIHGISDSDQKDWLYCPPDEISSSEVEKSSSEVENMSMEAVAITVAVILVIVCLSVAACYFCGCCGQYQATYKSPGPAVAPGTNQQQPPLTIV